MSRRSKNPTTHGAYAQEVVLPWEDAQEFDKLYEDVRRDLKPSGYLQDLKVRDIAKELWRKQRLAIGAVLPFYKKEMTPELMAAAKGGIASLAAYLADQSNRGGRLMSSDDIMDFHEQTRAAFKMGKLSLADLSTPDGPPKKTNGITAEIVEQAYDLAALERDLKIETMLDNRIKNHLAALAMLKSYNEMYGEKSIEVLPPPEASPVHSPNLSPAGDKVMTRSNGFANN
jgi:hypothetical protein